MVLGVCVVEDGVSVCEVVLSIEEEVAAVVSSTAFDRSSVLDSAGFSGSTAVGTLLGVFAAPTEATLASMAAGVDNLLACGAGSTTAGSACFSCTCGGVGASLGVALPDAEGLVSRGALAAGCGAGCCCEDEDSCGAGVLLADGSVVEGRGAACDAGLGAGRRTPAAFGLKADFLFNILSIQCPAAVVFRSSFATDGDARSCALPRMVPGQGNIRSVSKERRELNAGAVGSRRMAWGQ